MERIEVSLKCSFASELFSRKEGYGYLLRFMSFS